jgi:hypothetical protein
MSAEQKVHDFLVAHRGQSYCDDCLSTILAIKPRQIQQKTSALAEVCTAGGEARNILSNTSPFAEARSRTSGRNS